MNDFGFIRYISIGNDGIVGNYGIWTICRETPYTSAMATIRDLEENSQIAEGSYREAFDELLEGTFDESRWAQYKS